ncbi:MAG: hypothetical protein ACP5NY_04080 [Thermocladium sp.]
MNLRRVILDFQYGYGKYGAWVVQLTTMMLSAVAALRGVFPIPLLLLIVAASAVAGFSGMVLLGRVEVLRSGGFSGLEHALLTARNPIWSMYLVAWVHILEGQGMVEEGRELRSLLLKYMDPSDPARRFL